MTGFVLIAALMLAGAIGFVLPPLLRRTDNSRGASVQEANVAVYRNQLRELEADLASGTLSADQYDASRQEIERRLLEDVTAARQSSPRSARTASWPAIAVVLLVPLTASLLYWHLGTPSALGEAAALPAASPHGTAHGVTFEQIEVLTERLAERLAGQPDDAEGWAMLARSYNVLGRRDQAIAAYARAVERVPDDAQLLADYADALAMAQGGTLQGKPHQLIQRALTADARNVKALALAGTAAFDQRDYRGAARYWQRGLEAAGMDSEYAESLQASLTEARALAAGGAATGPAATASEPGRHTAPAHIAGRVTLAPELLAKAAPEDTVFVFARAASGPRMPLALVRRRVKDLPLAFVLDDSAAMTPAFKLSDFERVVVVARVSRSGSAEPHPGDLEGMSEATATSRSAVTVRIDKAL